MNVTAHTQQVEDNLRNGAEPDASKNGVGVYLLLWVDARRRVHINDEKFQISCIMIQIKLRVSCCRQFL